MKKVFVTLCVLAVASVAFAAETCNCQAGDSACYISCVQTKVTAARKATAEKIENAKAKAAQLKNDKTAQQNAQTKKEELKAKAKAKKEELKAQAEAKKAQAKAQ
ncbi:MAG: hypothetical protein IKC13_03325, partial [Elusimicrobiaceae bacterium]|nr:hypothetical protein [Elusimicrobiaceae bacterium]